MPWGLRWGRRDGVSVGCHGAATAGRRSSLLVLAVSHGCPREVVGLLHVDQGAVLHAPHHLELLGLGVGAHGAQHVLLLGLPHARLCLLLGGG